MNNDYYEGSILNDALNQMQNRKCCCPRYIPGPTGPTGPSGGPTGPTGPTGPRGESDTLTVGAVTTLDAGENAEVEITGDSPNYTINFKIPKGDNGTANLGAFASKYDTTENNIDLTTDTQSVLPLSTTGILNNITGDKADTLTITIDGTYKIDYLFQGSSDTAATLTLDVTKNAAQLAGSTITKDITPNSDESLQGSIIVSLKNGDEIALALESSTDITLTPTSGTNAYLNITKLA